MRAKYLILAIALLCVLALPSTALAADQSAKAKIDNSVTAVLDAAGERKRGARDRRSPCRARPRPWRTWCPRA